MTITLEQFARNFEPHPIPDILRALFLFQESAIEWYSDSFELDVVSQAVMKAHVRQEAIPQFFCFGHDGNDSWYALWHYKEMPLEEAPVVYLNSEGEGSTVFANNLLEFLTLLAYDEETIFGVYKGEEREHTTRNGAFRQWLDEQYHLQAVTQPNKVVQRAWASHPALRLWYA